MPLDLAGLLTVNGTHVAEYKIYINTPDTKSTSPISMDLRGAFIQYTVEVAGVTLPQSKYLRLQASGDTGALQKSSFRNGRMAEFQDVASATERPESHLICDFLRSAEPRFQTPRASCRSSITLLI